MKFKINFGIARNILLRSFFLVSVYSTTVLLSVKVSLSGFHWWYVFPLFGIPLWWIFDYLVIWRQEVDANYRNSDEWKDHKREIAEIREQLDRLEKAIGEIAERSKR